MNSGIQALGISVLVGAAMACSPQSGTLLGAGGSGPESTPSPAATPTDETVPPGAPADGSRLFPTDRLLQVRIELPEASWEALLAEPYVYTPAHAVLDGQRVDDVAVRLRGRIGSFREVFEKPKWRIDFNRHVPGRRIDGLEAISLDNHVVDCSGLKGVLGNHMLALAGVPASRAGLAEVYVNDAYYGVYTVLEHQDDRMLARVFEDGTGTLYDGAYIWYGDYNHTMLDFSAEVDALFELEEGVDNGNADVRRVSDALAKATGRPDFVEIMSEVVDMDAFYALVAGEHWIGQNDGYVLNTNNYRVYFDPTDGLARFIAYDLDYAFMPQPWGHTIDNPRGLLARACFADPACRSGVVAAMAELLERVEEADPGEFFDAIEEVSHDAALADPKRSCSAGDIRQARTYLSSWIASRGGQMRNYWGTP